MQLAAPVDSDSGDDDAQSVDSACPWRAAGSGRVCDLGSDGSGSESDDESFDVDGFLDMSGSGGEGGCALDRPGPSGPRPRRGVSRSGGVVGGAGSGVGLPPDLRGGGVFADCRAGRAGLVSDADSDGSGSESGGEGFGDDSDDSFIDDGSVSESGDPLEFISASRGAFSDGGASGVTPRGTTRPRGRGSGPDTEPSAPMSPEAPGCGAFDRAGSVRSVVRRLDREPASWGSSGGCLGVDDGGLSPVACSDDDVVFGGLGADALEPAPVPTTDLEHAMATVLSSSGDEAPEGLPSVTGAYVEPTEFQEHSSAIHAAYTDVKSRRDELRTLEVVPREMTDVAVVARLVFWAKVGRDYPALCDAQRECRAMTKPVLMACLISRFGVDRSRLMSTTRRGDATVSELMKLFVLESMAVHASGALDETVSDELRALQSSVAEQVAVVKRLRAIPRENLSSAEIAHLHAADASARRRLTVLSEQRAADRAAEVDRLGAAAVAAGEDGEYEQLMAQHRKQMYENLSSKKERRGVPVGRRAADICSGEVKVPYWSAMGVGPGNVLPQRVVGGVSVDDVDKDNRVACVHCGALHFQSESAAKRSSCCAGGRLAGLPRWEVPLRDESAHAKVYELWRANTVPGKLFRKHCRRLNNALSLSWLSVDRSKSKSGGAWSPTLVVNGKLTAWVGPLEAAAGDESKFAQLYVLGDDDDNGASVLDRRLGLVMDGLTMMCVPCKQKCKSSRGNCIVGAKCPACAALLETERLGLKALLQELTSAFRRTNPWVRSFVTAAEELRRVDAGGGEIVEHVAVIDADAAPAGAAPRTYNAAAFDSEIMMCMPDVANDRPWGAFHLRLRGGGLQTLDPANRCADPTHFPLLFPGGQDGWSRGVRVPSTARDANGVRIQRSVTPKEWYNYYSFERRRHPRSPLGPEGLWDSSLHRAGRLFQEYICWGWVKAEDRNLSYIASVHGQRAIRAEKYGNLRDHVSGTDHLLHVGRIVLPCTVRGSPRKMKKNFEDAMATVRVFGTPSLFITFTASAGAPEVKACLNAQGLKGQTAVDRWDLVSAVFNEHVRCMIRELMVDNVFGEAVARFHVLEFQKRGLPHVHLLVWLAEGDAVTDASSIDSIISAQLPQATALRDQVCLTNVHKCDTHCRDAFGGCNKRYPKDACEETRIRPQEEPGTDFVLYRRDVVDTAVVNGGRKVNSLWVVPYSPYMTLRHLSHVNVEVRCCTRVGVGRAYSPTFRAPAVMVRRVEGWR